MVLNKWKDGKSGHFKAMLAALVNALIIAGIVTALFAIGLAIFK